MVLEPWMTAERDLPGEKPSLLLARQRRRGAEQRMLGGDLSHRAHVHHTSLRGKPIALTLTSGRGEQAPRRAAVLDGGAPADLHAVGVGLREQADQLPGFGAA